MYAISQTTPPATEPISLAEAKSHARIDSSDEDTLLGIYITAARQAYEAVSGLALITQTWTQYHDCWFGGEISLMRNPVASVSSVKYYDADNAQQTFSSANYFVDTFSTRARIVLAPNVSLPSTYDRPNVWEIEFVCGAATAEAIDKQILQLIVADWYELRQSPVGSFVPETMKIPFAVQNLIIQRRR